MRFSTYLFAAATALTLLLVDSAQAQSLGRMLTRTGLVQEDINIMTGAAAELYTAGNARVGDDVIWSNPQTGAFGMIEVIEVEENCVRLAYRFQAARKSTTQTVTIRRCLVDGQWIVSN